MNKEKTTNTNKVRVVFPRRSSNKPAASSKAAPTYTNRIKSISTNAGRKSTLDPNTKLKEVSTVKNAADNKQKIVYNPVHVYNIMSPQVHNQSSPSGSSLKQPKSFPTRSGKFSIFEKSKAGATSAPKRPPKMKVEELRKKLSSEIEHNSSDSIEDLEPTNRISSTHTNDPKKVSKSSQSQFSKPSGSKLGTKKASTKSHTESLEGKGECCFSQIHNPKLLPVDTLSNARSAEKIETLKYAVKIKPTIVSVLSDDSRY